MLKRLLIALCTAVCGLAFAAPAALAADTLLGSQTLTAGQTLVSSDSHYELAMQGDGNLVFYVLSGTSGQRALWSSGTRGDTGDHALLQRNGALVLLDPSGQTLWSTNTSTAGCTNLVVQDDGNLVLYPSSLKAVWATNDRPTSLIAGDTLTAGQVIYAPGEQNRLVMQSDGNLVLYDDAGAALWSSRTSGHPGSRAVMQSDGNLVVYSGSTALFSTKTSGHAGADLAVQADGNLVVYSAGKAIWNSATEASRPTGPVLFHKPAFQACPAPPPPPTTTTTTTTTTPPPTAPVVSVPVTSPSPRKLRIKMILSWTWNHGTTRLHRIEIPRMPRRATLTVSCRGRGCPRHARRSDYRHLKRLIRWLDGHRYRAGQHVTLVIAEKGYKPERVRADIRNGHLPRVRLLR